MEYGEIFAGTFRTIWHHKRLWLFGIVGLFVSSIGSGLYLTFLMGWQRDWLMLMSNMANQAEPEAMLGRMMNSMIGLWVALGVLGLAAILSYMINLVMRGATIHEAALAWQSGESDTGRGLRIGFAVAVYLFLIDLLWWLPSIVIMGGGYALAIVTIIGLGAAGGNDAGAVAGLVGFFAVLCTTLCLGLLIVLAAGIFAPLMYQSAVQGRRGPGAAIKEGWNLTRTHLGAMIVFWILLLAMGLALGILLQGISLPFWLPWFTSMMNFSIASASGMRSAAPPAFSGALLALLGVVVALTSLLSSSFLQTFHLTLYAEVYRRITGNGSGSPAPQPALDDVPPDSGLTVPDEADTTSDSGEPLARV